MRVVMTVCDRPQYLDQALASWAKVRGLNRTHFSFCCEPTIKLCENLELINHWLGLVDVSSALVYVNEHRLGVSRNPYTGIGREFDLGHSYVLATEDDIIVSDDVIEYHEWASQHFSQDKNVAIVCSYTTGTGDIAGVERRPVFSPLVWGTWKDRWNEYVGAEWDVDVVHYSDNPWHEAGWDWHLVRRILPPRKKVCVFPHSSRSDHIGVWGTFSTPDLFQTAKSFRPHYDCLEYFEGGESEFDQALMR